MAMLKEIRPTFRLLFVIVAKSRVLAEAYLLSQIALPYFKHLVASLGTNQTWRNSIGAVDVGAVVLTFLAEDDRGHLLLRHTGRRCPRCRVGQSWIRRNNLDANTRFGGPLLSRSEVLPLPSVVVRTAPHSLSGSILASVLRFPHQIFIHPATT